MSAGQTRVLGPCCSALLYSSCWLESGRAGPDPHFLSVCYVTLDKLLNPPAYVLVFRTAAVMWSKRDK